MRVAMRSTVPSLARGLTGGRAHPNTPCSIRMMPRASRGLCWAAAGGVKGAELTAEQVAERYSQVLKGVNEATVAAGRTPGEVKLLAVTKTFPLDHVLPAHTVGGSMDFGENRVEEALDKVAEAKDRGLPMRWHFIGTIQSRKVRKVIEPGCFDLIHSVDTPKLAERISKVCAELGTEQRILLQVNTSGEEAKAAQCGVEDWQRAVDGGLLDLPGLRVHGLMTMAPFVDDEQILRDCFARLRMFRDELQAGCNTGAAIAEFLAAAGPAGVEGAGGPLGAALEAAEKVTPVTARHPLTELSMGMTNDYKIAIEEGATMVRIGREIFGER